MQHPSHSDEQKEVELHVYEALAMQLGVTFSEQPQALKKLRLDAFATGPQPVLVEVLARHGRSKAGRKRKLSRDMTKLLLAERLLNKPSRKIIALVDPCAIAHFEKA